MRAADGVVEATVCYTGDVSNPSKQKYTLEYYVDLTEQLVAHGIDVLAISDMAGLLKPRAATMPARCAKSSPDLPIHVHTPHRRHGRRVDVSVRGGGRGRRDVCTDALAV